MLPTNAEAPLGVSRIHLDGNVMVLEAAALDEGARCPGCGTLSRSICSVSRATASYR